VLAGVVVGQDAGTPLGYSVVSIPGIGPLGTERYAGPRGTFAFPDLPPGAYTLRVKHLGYAPAEVPVQLLRGRVEVRVALTRVVVRLPVVVVRPECTTPGAPDPAAAPDFAVLFDQVRQNAERYRLLAREYPYQYVVERTFSDQLRNGEYPITRVDTVTFASNTGWRYAPGRMVRTEVSGWRREQVLTLPTLADIVDSAFLANHCFFYAGLDTLTGVTLLRVDFLTAKRLRAPDIDGSVYLDTATYQIRGDRIRLTRVPAAVSGLEGVSATTLFQEVVPAVPIRSYVVGRNVFSPRPGPQTRVASIETQILLEVRFLRAIPGADAPAARPASPPRT
jgi:hypothetical protein